MSSTKKLKKTIETNKQELSTVYKKSTDFRQLWSQKTADFIFQKNSDQRRPTTWLKNGLPKNKTAHNPVLKRNVNHWTTFSKMKPEKNWKKLNVRKNNTISELAKKKDKFV